MRYFGGVPTYSIRKGVLTSVDMIRIDVVASEPLCYGKVASQVIKSLLRLTL